MITRSEYDENIKTDYMDNIKMLKNVYFKTIRNKKKTKKTKQKFILCSYLGNVLVIHRHTKIAIIIIIMKKIVEVKQGHMCLPPSLSLCRKLVDECVKILALDG